MGRLIDVCKVVGKINSAIEQMGKASETAAGNEGFQTTIKAYKDVRDAIMQEPTAEPETCEGCKHLGKWENEFEYGYPSPCTRCKRRAEDHYER